MKDDYYLGQLIKFKTNANVDSINDCLEYIGTQLKKYNWKVNLIKNKENDKLNMVAILGDCNDINQGLLLSGHIDTVETDIDRWSSDPWALINRGEYYYGLGVSDMKSFTSAILANLDEIAKLQLKKPLMLSLTSDEETVMYGINAVCKFISDNNIKPNCAIIGEPSKMKFVTANKGFYEFKTSISGCSCHSSEPSLGTNAIYLMSRFVTFLQNIANEYKDKDTTLNVGIINGGTMCNMVPDLCTINWELRTFEESIKLEIVNKVNNFLVDLCKNEKNAEFNNNNVFSIPAFEYRENNLIKFAREKYVVDENYYDAATEAGFYQKMNIDCIIFGAGDIKDAHTYNEKLSIKDYKKYIELLLDIIKNQCC